MKRATMLTLALAALTAIALVPLPGHALHGVVAECFQYTSASTTCTATFELDEPGFVSNLESHGNFHDLADLGDRKVTVQWIDADGELIFSSECTIVGLSTSELGPMDLQNATCSNTYHEQSYAAGEQTLLVTAETGGAPTNFHGALSISPGSSPL